MMNPAQPQDCNTLPYPAQTQEANVLHNVGPFQENNLPYPSQQPQGTNVYQHSVEPTQNNTLASPLQGWINPQTDRVSCNPQHPPPAYHDHNTEGSNNATHAIPPPAYEDSD